MEIWYLFGQMSGFSYQIEPRQGRDHAIHFVASRLDIHKYLSSE